MHLVRSPAAANNSKFLWLPLWFRSALAPLWHTCGTAWRRGLSCEVLKPQPRLRTLGLGWAPGRGTLPRWQADTWLVVMGERGGGQLQPFCGVGVDEWEGGRGGGGMSRPRSRCVGRSVCLLSKQGQKLLKYILLKNLAFPSTLGAANRGGLEGWNPCAPKLLHASLRPLYIYE